MPIKWTAEVDHTLLLKILEVHDIHVNTKLISEKWPGTEKPTARAISERLVKLRSLVKQSGGGEGHFAISTKPSNGTPKTPRTPTSVRKNRATAVGSASARKKAAVGVKKENVLPSTETEGAEVKDEPIDLTGPAIHATFPSSLPTPSDSTEAAALSMDGAFDDHDPLTPTPTRMVTRGRRVATYATDEDEDEGFQSDDSDISNFHSAHSEASDPYDEDMGHFEDRKDLI